MTDINKGAINAIRGYRKQFLYTLYRILKDKDYGFIFEPEGFFEDLDIKNNKGEYIETIQIKNTSGTLTFSDLFSKKDSFFKRAKNAIKLGTSSVKLICFGELSDELKDTSLNKVKKKLIKKGFTEKQITQIAQVYSVEIVSEKEIQTWVHESIKKYGEFIDPLITIDLLMFWLFQVAENQTSVNTKEFITQLNAIGKYNSARIDFHRSFGNTIQPLEIKYFTKDKIDLFKDGFYYGVSAKYEHILAEVDVPREKRLKEIEDAFKNSNVVFIHGASGQGKSSLAYRYLKNSQSQYASYELKLSNDLGEVLQTINSIESLCKGLNFPVVLYIDVTSQYIHWKEVVQELYDKNNIQFLITMRQEDWNKLSIEHYFNFTDIELTFDKEEAKELYYHLSTHKSDLKFISFEESWTKAGEQSPLLEYVYLLTQGVTLKSRLKEQIRRIQEKVETKKTKDIEILRYVSLSDTFGSRINYKSLVQYLEISNPALYIDFFKKEYLLQLSDDKHYLIGLHPVRSKVISEILFNDDIFIDKYDYIDNAFKMIHEEDFHNFLLYAFNCSYDVNRSIELLSSFKVKTWSGLNNIGKALIWKGVYDYIFIDNISVFNELHDTYKNAWPLFLNFDLSGVNKEDALIDIIKIFHTEEEAQGEAIKKYHDINAKLTDANNIYKYCKKWISPDLIFPIKGTSDKDWNSYGEFLFRLSLFTRNYSSITVDFEELQKYFNETDATSSMSNILLGLKASKLVDNINVELLELSFVKSIRTKYNIVSFVNTGDKIITKYFFDLINFESDESISNPFHEKTLEIQNLIRKAFPEIQEFEINGYGHNFLGIDMPDDTYKCMPRKNLPLKLLTEQNALVTNLYNYSLRLDTWQEYVNILMDNRRMLLSSLESLKKGMLIYFKDNNKGIDYLVSNELKIKKEITSLNQLLPKCTIDMWGYKGESETNKLDTSNLQKTDTNNTLHKFEELKTTNQNYFTYSQNFINQSFTEIDNTIKRIEDPNFKVENDNLRNVTECNLSDSAYNLIKFQDEFERCFGKFLLPHEVSGLSKKESKILFELMTIWKDFLYSPYRIKKFVNRLADLNFDLTRDHLLKKIYKEVIQKNAETGFPLHVSTDSEEKRFILKVETNSENYVDSIDVCLEIIIEIFSSMHHTSLKNLITKLNFDKVSIIHLFNGHPINNKYLDIPMFRVDKLDEMIKSDTEITNIFDIFSYPTDINKITLNKEGLIPWNEQIIEISSYEKIMGVASGMKLICKQFKELDSYFTNIDEIGAGILNTYRDRITQHFKNIISQDQSGIDVVRSITFIEKEFFENIKDSISGIMNYLDIFYQKDDITIIDLELINKYSNTLEENYTVFSEYLILDFLEKENEKQYL